MYCKNCGKETKSKKGICRECASKKTETEVVTNTIINSTSINYESKSKVAAGLLGIFLGSFGVHNFYLGYTGKAIAQLLITLCTCGIGASITSIWGLIEGILILTGSINTDANGINLKD